MGGPGAGHKSWEARQSRLVNIQKARAARRRAPLPWRSGLESRIIEQLVWQWFLEVGGRRLEVGLRDQNAYEQQIPHHRDRSPRLDLPSTWEAPFCGDRVRNDNVRIPRSRHVRRQERPWAKYRVARFLGVSHTWVNKLVKRFEADPERMRRRMAAFAPTSFEKLERAREETRRQREMGWPRGPIRVRRVKVTLWGKRRAVAVLTRAEKRRREGQAARPVHVRYQELPMWARGLLLPGGITVTGSHATDPPGSPSRGPGRPRFTRAVPFAFRRRR